MIASTIPKVASNSLEHALLEYVFPVEDDCDAAVNEQDADDVVLFDPPIFPV